MSSSPSHNFLTLFSSQTHARETSCRGKCVAVHAETGRLVNKSRTRTLTHCTHTLALSILISALIIIRNVFFYSTHQEGSAHAILAQGRRGMVGLVRQEGCAQVRVTVNVNESKRWMEWKQESIVSHTSRPAAITPSYRRESY